MMKFFAEKRRFFPDPAAPTLDGIVAMGDELRVETLFEAYSFGIFPWPHPDLPCLWFCPDERGVLDFSELHISRSLQREMRRQRFQFTVNKNFPAVIEECGHQPRAGQTGTWITPLIKKVYVDFHKAGYAHSVECWDGARLVGGIYGVYVGGVFSGESMFFKESNASKLCLLKLIEFLQANGLQWMDIQMVTSVTQSLGGKYIAKREFLERLALEKDRMRTQGQPLNYNVHL
jgi:leucyl/phenylalanyl-tRNA--protein transferase